MHSFQKSIIQKLRDSETYKKNQVIDWSTCWDTDLYQEVERKQLLVEDRLRFLRRNLSRAAGRKNAHVIEIDLDYVYAIGEKQDWKCAVSGDVLEFVRGGSEVPNQNCNLKSCTIDRINSALGYVEGNIQLVTWEVNAAKGARSTDRFLAHCQQVIEYNNKEEIKEQANG